jgi:hypothetical protein
MPIFNALAITTMVDRWRPEIHSFLHLSCGKMTMTLEDVAMILGLLISGQAGASLCDHVGWRQRVADFLGRNPVDITKRRKGREAGVHISWLCQEFQHFPKGVDDAIVSYYARAWV